MIAIRHMTTQFRYRPGHGHKGYWMLGKFPGVVLVLVKLLDTPSLPDLRGLKIGVTGLVPARNSWSTGFGAGRSADAWAFHHFRRTCGARRAAASKGGIDYPTLGQGIVTA